MTVSLLVRFDGKEVEQRCRKKWELPKVCASRMGVKRAKMYAIWRADEPVSEAKAKNIKEALGSSWDELGALFILPWVPGPRVSPLSNERQNADQRKLWASIADYDRTGDECSRNEAIRNCQNLLNALEKDRDDETGFMKYILVFDRLMALWSEAGESDKSLKEYSRIKKWLDNTGRLKSRQVTWLIYQSAICRRRLNQFDRARRELKAIEKRNPTPEQRLASLHQLGEIDLAEGNLARARSAFQQCRELWIEEDPTNFRRGYTLRCLAEVEARERRYEQASGAFLEAIKLFTRAGIDRATNETQTLFEELVLCHLPKTPNRRSP